MNVLEISDLSKTYHRHAVVDRVSLQLPKGRIYGFLGLNGAGKTTTMRMMLGMIAPSAGKVSWFGGLPPSTAVWARVGYMIESTHAYPNLTTTENLRLFYHYHGLREPAAIDRTIRLLQLGAYRDTKARHLSMGNLQRLGLARALLHRPEVLILDEPVNGLDPAGIAEIRALLKELSRQGTSIFISSHLLDEIARVADTIGIIHEGRLIRELAAADLKQEVRRKLILDTADNARAAQTLRSRGIETRQNVRKELEIMDEQALREPESIAGQIVNGGIGLKKLYTFEEDLESYFLRTIQPTPA